MKNEAKTNDAVGFLQRFLKIHILLILASTLLLFSPKAQAAPIGLKIYPPPLITFSYAHVSYDASNDLLVVDGYTDGFFPYDETADQYDIYYDAAGTTRFSTINITANIDQDGNLVWDSSTGYGSLTVSGYVPDMAGEPGWPVSPTGTLLTGDLADFGFNTTRFEFDFDNLAGDAAYLFLDVFERAGVWLDYQGFPDTTWTTDWDRSNATGMVAPSPIPSAVWLLASGLIAFLGIRRKL